jgi:mono/diheme cytochrome c family protein
MTGGLRSRWPLRTFLMWIRLIHLTFTIVVVSVIAQSPAGSDGWHIPEGAAAETNPEALNPAAIARGQNLYKSKCQRCHGVDGSGRGPDADPEHPPGDLSDGRRASRNPDGVMFYKMWNGRAKPRMPAMNADMSRADAWKVIGYVKTLRK